jgi:leader peptidase (prepilin peptidase)/N-methyltransferase
MYPLVELVTGLLFVGCYLEFGITQATAKWLFFLCLIVILTVTDLRVRLLPDLVTWPGFAVGLLFSAFVPPDEGDFGAYLIRRLSHWDFADNLGGIAEGLLGAAFGSFLLWGVGAVFKFVRKQEGMGAGDVKMMAMVGAFLGVKGTFLTILLGSLLGSALGIVVVMIVYASGAGRKVAERASRRGIGKANRIRWFKARQYQLPFGTFLGIAAVVVVFVFSSLSIHLAPRLR